MILESKKIKKIGYCLSIDEIYEFAERKEFSEYCDFIDLSGRELVSISEQSFKKLNNSLNKLGIPCRGIHATFPLDIKLTGTQYEPQKVLDYFAVLQARCELLGIRMIGVGSPGSRNLENGFAEAEADKQMIQILRLLSDHGHDMSILLEACNLSEGNYIVSSNKVSELVDSVNRSNVGAVCDIYHFWLLNEDPDRIIPRFYKKTAYIHIADPNGRIQLSRKTSEEYLDYVRKIISNLSHVECIAIETGTACDVTLMKECYEVIHECLSRE